MPAKVYTINRKLAKKIVDNILLVLESTVSKTLYEDLVQAVQKASIK